MKNFKSLLPFLLMVFALVGCDTDDLRNDVDELKNRVESLEAQVTAINENMNVLQVLVEGNKTISAYEETEDGYKLTLSDGQVLTLTQGVQGTVSTPSVSVSADGYWVINDQKTDAKAVGSNAPAPQFNVDAEGYWTVDLGDGNGAQRVQGPNGDVKASTTGDVNVVDEFFKEVKFDGNVMTVTYKDGNKYSLEIVADLLCEIVDPTENFKNNVLTVGYGTIVELKVKVKGDKYFVTAPAGWTAVLSEPNADTNEATITLKAPAASTEASTLGRASADNTRDLTLQVNKGNSWAVDQIQVVAAKVITSYYSLFESGEAINIAGIELKKSDWEGIDDFEIRQISADGNDTDANKITANGIYFIQPGAVAVYAYTGAVTNMYILRDKPNDYTATLKMMNNFVALNNNSDAINSKFFCEGLVFDASSATTSYQFTANGDFGNIIFKNCTILIHPEKPLVYIDSSVSREFQSVIFENCKLNFTGRGTQTFVFNVQTSKINSISLINNVFYTEDANDVKTQLFGMGTVNDLPQLIMKNNTFYNVVPEADGFVKCKSFGAIDIENNLFHSSDYKNYNVLLRFADDGVEGAVSGTGVTRNNYGNKGSKAWKVYNKNSVLEGSEQVKNTYVNLFSYKDAEHGIFTPITELEGCGANFD